MAINKDKYKDRESTEGTSGKQAEEGEFTVKDDKTYNVRVLPHNIDEYEADTADKFGHKIKFHYNYTLLDGTKIWNIPCPKAWGMDNVCPICDEGYALFNSKNAEDKKLSKDFYRSEQVLLNLIDLTDEESVKKGIQFWKSPIKKVYQEIEK